MFLVTPRPYPRTQEIGHHDVEGGDDDCTELSVETDDAVKAIGTVSETFEKAVAMAGLPWWPIVRISALTDEELDAELARPSFPDLVGIREIADLLEVSAQRASTLSRSAAFPAPAAELRAGPVWTASSVRRFVEEWARQPGRPKAKVAG